MRKSVAAVGWGVLAAAGFDLAARWLLWPRLLQPGALDLSQPNVRLLFTLTGAIPALVGGWIAARRAPSAPLVHGAIVGGLLLIPMLLELPAVLRAYAEVPQSMVPLVVAMILRPLGGLAGGYLSGRVAPAAPAPPIGT